MGFCGLAESDRFPKQAKIHSKTDMTAAIASKFSHVMGNLAFSRLKDSVTGEFLHYIQNNFGVSKLNKVIREWRQAKIPGLFRDFIGQKLKGFYAINGKGCAPYSIFFQNLFSKRF